MANIKFSAFTQKVAQADVDFLVGYTGTDNVRIAPSTIGQGVYVEKAGDTMTGDLLAPGIGIGTTGAPIELLHLYGGVGNPTRIRLQADDGQDDVLTFHQATTQKGAVGYDDSDDVVSLTYGGLSATTGIKINSSGNVGIGTSTPGNKLEVQTTSNGHGVMFKSNATQIGSIFRTAIGGTVSMTIDGAGTRPISINNGSSSNVLIANGGGNVGIGETNPLGKLHVKNTAEIYTSLAGADSAVNFIENGGNPWRIGNRSADDSFRFSQDSTSLGANVRVTFANGGNVGIGTADPETLIHIYKVAGSAQLTLERTGGGAGKAVLAGAAGGLIVYNDSFSPKMYVGTSGSYEGSVGIGTISPASKLEVDGGDIEVDDSASGLILKSPDGTRYRVTVANGGTLSVSAV